MSNILGHPVKSIFSRAALAVINACAKFAYNFSYGFGIKCAKSSGSVVVSLDTDSEALTRWIRDTGTAPKMANENLEENAGGDSTQLLSGLELDKTEWIRGETVQQSKDEESGQWEDSTDEGGNTTLTGIRMQVVSRVVRAYDTDYFFWRWAFFDPNGCLYKLSAEQGVFAEVNYDEYSSV